MTGPAGPRPTPTAPVQRTWQQLYAEVREFVEPNGEAENADGEPLTERGWYFRFDDSNHEGWSGPFTTEALALASANAQADEYEGLPEQPDTGFGDLPLCDCGEPTCRGGCRVEDIDQ